MIDMTKNSFHMKWNDERDSANQMHQIKQKALKNLKKEIGKACPRDSQRSLHIKHKRKHKAPLNLVQSYDSMEAMDVADKEIEKTETKGKKGKPPIGLSTSIVSNKSGLPALDMRHSRDLKSNFQTIGAAEFYQNEFKGLASRSYRDKGRVKKRRYKKSKSPSPISRIPIEEGNRSIERSASHKGTRPTAQLKHDSSVQKINTKKQLNKN